MVFIILQYDQNTNYNYKAFLYFFVFFYVQNKQRITKSENENKSQTSNKRTFVTTIRIFINCCVTVKNNMMDRIIRKVFLKAFTFTINKRNFSFLFVPLNLEE